MNFNRILTRKTMGLDNRVWWVMFIMLIISVGLLSSKLMDHENCIPVSVSIKPVIHHEDNAYYTDEIISFYASGVEKLLSWDFNDNTAKQEGRYVTHRFKDAGKYYIKITSPSGCESIQPITILKSVPITEDIGSEEKILGHSSTFVGSPEFFNATVKADSYEWNVLQYPKYGPRTGDSTTYNFSEPGDYTIELTLNGDRSRKFRKTVHVEAVVKAPVTTEPVKRLIPTLPSQPEGTENTGIKPPSGTPLHDTPVITRPVNESVKIKKTYVPDNQFKDLLQSLLNDAMDVNGFNQYLISEGATKVQVNGEKEFKTFTWLCQELKGKHKKYKLKTVRLSRDESDNVSIIHVEYKKKGLFGL